MKTVAFFAFSALLTITLILAIVHKAFAYDADASCTRNGTEHPAIVYSTGVATSGGLVDGRLTATASVGQVRHTPDPVTFGSGYASIMASQSGPYYEYGTASARVEGFKVTIDQDGEEVRRWKVAADGATIKAIKKKEK